MSFIQSDLDALDAARKQGSRRERGKREKKSQMMDSSCYTLPVKPPSLRSCGLFLGALLWCTGCTSPSRVGSLRVQSCEQKKGDELKACQENQKLQLDLAKAQDDGEREIVKAWISGITIGVPIMLAIIGVFIERWRLDYQRRLDREARMDEEKNEREARLENERLQFQLKAAEVAMNAIDSGQVRTKAKILSALFPDRLPKNFADDLNPTTLRFGPGGPQFKLELLKLLAQFPDERKAILQAWGVMFPGDKGWKPEDHPNYFWFNELTKEFN